MGTTLDERLAARLAELRAQHDWSLDDLAERSGVSRSTLSRLERGEVSPTASLLGRLCSAYGWTASRLLEMCEPIPLFGADNRVALRPSAREA